MSVPQGTKLQIFIIAYFLFISLVPGSPSYYRLLVDTVGTQLSLLSLGFLELYLNSRPLPQQSAPPHCLLPDCINYQGMDGIYCWVNASKYNNNDAEFLSWSVDGPVRPQALFTRLGDCILHYVCF